VEGDLERPLPPPLPIGVTYAPLLSQDGKLRNIIVSVRDITHFRTADEIKATFISIVSHELRTPVALIKGYASTLRRDDARWDKATISDSLAVIEEEADRLSKMIDDLLDASRLQAGGIEPESRRCLAAGSARRVAERFTTQSNKHTIVAEFPENFPIILADETRIEQVVSNLVSNALKYAPKGEIKITGTAARNRSLSVSAMKGRESKPGTCRTSSTAFIARRKLSSRQKARGWDSILPARSSRPTAGASGRTPSLIPGQGSVSHYRVNSADRRVYPRDISNACGSKS
jgi:light-regulated signal transduction histidine kinase (bacteriophytochrome)